MCIRNNICNVDDQYLVWKLGMNVPFSVVAGWIQRVVNESYITVRSVGVVVESIPNLISVRHHVVRLIGGVGYCRCGQDFSTCVDANDGESREMCKSIEAFASTRKILCVCCIHLFGEVIVVQ